MKHFVIGLALLMSLTGCISIPQDRDYDRPVFDEPMPLYGNPLLSCSERNNVRVKIIIDDKGHLKVVPDIEDDNNDFFCSEFSLRR